MLSAALLHDVVEDTGVSIDIVRMVFGEEIAEFVLGLTNISRKEDGNRPIRKAIDRNHTWDQSDNVQVIKCADIIHNMSDLAERDFGKQYAKEKLLLLEGMRIQDHPIWKRAKKVCESIA
jgi:(p)ppGpp synthase/HD superfamily hydrolase